MFLPMALFVAAMLSVDAVSNEQEIERVSVLVSTNAPLAGQQDDAASVMDALDAPLMMDGPVLGGQVVPYQTQRVPSLSPEQTMMMPPPSVAGCDTCCEVVCCCRKCPTTANFCLIDPDGCEVEFCARIPECCVGHQPKVSWRCGIFGRKIATLCWDCCPQTVKVIVTRRGKIKVRD